MIKKNTVFFLRKLETLRLILELIRILVESGILECVELLWKFLQRLLCVENMKNKKKKKESISRGRFDEI